MAAARPACADQVDGISNQLVHQLAEVLGNPCDIEALSGLSDSPKCRHNKPPFAPVLWKAVQQHKRLGLRHRGRDGCIHHCRRG